MLVDPLPVKALSLASATAITVLRTDSYALIDLSPGKTVRKCASLSDFISPGTLTIAHSVSKENGSVATDRLLVRLDITGLRPAPDATGDLKAFAYMVVGAPRGAFDGNNSAFSVPDMVYNLIGAVAVSPTAATLSNANLIRMIAGEP